MTDVAELFARQAEWQKKRKELSWPEKIRLVERIRADAERLRKGGVGLKKIASKEGRNDQSGF